MNQGSFGGGQPPGGYPPGGQGGYPQGGGYPGAGGGYGQAQAYGGAPGAPQGGAPGGYGQAPQPGGYGQAPQPGGYGQAPQPGGYGQAPQPGGYGQAPQPGAPGGPQEAWGQQQQQWGQQQQQWGQQQQQPGYGPPPGGAYGQAPGGGYGQAPAGGYGQAPQMGYAQPGGAVNAADVRFSFEGTGGELFGKLFVGFLLTGITFGIYGPWFAVSFINYVLEKTRIATPRGPMQVSFRGTGGDLFGVGFVGYLLTAITFGIYAPWFMCKLARFFADNMVGQTSDGRTYQLRFTGEGGDLFGKLFVNAILTGITFYIYMPWALCNMRKWFYQKTQITENGTQIGHIDFVGEGSTLFGTFIVGALLTGITFGIYAAWFTVNLKKFFDQNTRITVNGQSYAMDFTGQGVDLFVLRLVNGLLTAITFGIYWFWAKAKMLKWEYENTLVRRV